MIQLENKLYTSTEVADILGVSLRSVYRYIEENKLNPEVKTATGRHRFTKQNIVDFLYPNGEMPEQQPEPKAQVKEVKEVKEPKAAPVKPQVEEVLEEEPVAPEPQPEKPAKKPVEEAPKTVSEEEPVDWLAKFRDAAKRFESEKTDKDVEMDDFSTSSISGGGVTTAKETSVIEEKEEEPEFQQVYYRSRLGGLKDIAQNIDKSSRNAGLEYAFTLNAGLSLFKPIRPFSLLHSYIKPKDKEFFERMLMLVPWDQANAQLCLILTDNDRVFATKIEMHGLYVVSKDRLKEDIDGYGDSSLSQEAESALK